MARVNPFEFMQQVRSEAAKVSWPTRRETGITTAMVFVFVLISCVFFLLADQVLRIGIGLLLGIGR
jgi:preprotein translocase subunit SecE